MDRRSFIKFMGASATSVAASTALAKIPEAESQIILLDKPKDIIIAKNLPDVDFVITGITNISYNRNENVTYPVSLISKDPLENPMLGMLNIIVNVEVMREFCDFNFYDKGDLKECSTFTFNLNFDTPFYDQYQHLLSLNGRKFNMVECTVNSSPGSFITASITGHEIKYDY